ncbi:hypothetical protein N7534_007796, partial [Penicillium rubens]
GARMDGCLMGVNNPNIFVIAKVAKSDQNAGPSLSRVVKVGDPILHDDEEARETSNHQCLLVSQDNHEIWLTLATYDEEYA